MTVFKNTKIITPQQLATNATDASVHVFILRHPAVLSDKPAVFIPLGTNVLVFDVRMSEICRIAVRRSAASVPASAPAAAAEAAAATVSFSPVFDCCFVTATLISDLKKTSATSSDNDSAFLNFLIL